MILAGDVGGTKVDLALYSFVQGKLQVATEKKYAARDYPSLEVVVKEFLDEAKPVEPVTSACFGVPGPVRNGRLKLTNLPWVLDSRVLSHDLDIDHLFLINDLEANGFGIPELPTDKIYTLSPGRPQCCRHSRAHRRRHWDLARPCLSGMARCTRRWLPKEAILTSRRAMKMRSTCCATCKKKTEWAA